MTTEATALKRYNSLFDNAQYQRVTQAIADDLNVERASVIASDAANLITDAALGLSGHPSYTEACHTLAIFCGRNSIRLTTIATIYDYLVIFQQVGDTHADDFEAVAKALHYLQSIKSLLPVAVSHANGIHSWRGRMAYDLLAASDFLAQAAVQLLMHGNEAYIREKLQSGLQRITGALHEGARHSQHPELFDFSTTRFPTTDDHR
jgi:hypothetical protein